MIRTGTVRGRGRYLHKSASVGLYFVRNSDVRCTEGLSKRDQVEEDNDSLLMESQPRLGVMLPRCVIQAVQEESPGTC